MAEEYAEYEQNDYVTAPTGLNWQPFDEYGFVSPWAPHWWKASVGINYTISMIVTSVIAVTFYIVCDQCRHWCLLPLTLCGIITGEAVVAWFRKEVDIFDPKAVVCGRLYLNCFLAPLLHLTYDSYGGYFHMSNWPFYFGYMAIFNVTGLILFKLGHHMFFKVSRPVKSFWQLSPDKFTGILIPVLGISLAATAVIRFFFGGLAKELGVITFAGGSQAYAAHISWIDMLGSPLPILLIMAAVYLLQNKNLGKPSSLLTVICILIIIMVFQLILYGAQGSRSTILSGVIIIAAMIHYRLRPLSIKFILVSICVMAIFVHLYGFYKMFGVRGWEAFYSAEARKSMGYERGGDTLVGFITGQFARADVQAFMLYRLTEHKGAYKFRKGLTYGMSVLTFIPRGIWKTKPISVKAVAGTEIQGFSAMEYSHAVYGLAGEAMLNFSYYGIVPAFFVLGCVLGWLRKKIATIEPYDARFFLIPILFLTSYFVLGDTNNWVQGLLRISALPFIVIFFSSNRSKFVVNKL